MRKIICLLFLLFFFSLTLFSQVTTVNIDLRASRDTTVTITDAPDRNGLTCGISGSGNTNCIVFNVLVNAASDQISFDIIGAPGLGSAAYQVNCGQSTSLATPICLNGISSAAISFCKNGNNGYTYKITTSTLVKGSNDITLRQNCSGTMSVTGLQAASVTWSSIFPGSAGQYNGYLSNASGVTTTTVTPAIGAPAYIDYRVSGSTSSCSIAKADTIRVYTTPPLSIAISPANPAICSNTPITLTASPSGGNPPYTYLWTGGETIATKTVVTAATYTVTVNDNTSGCAAVPQAVTIAALPTPAAPTAPGTTICAGTTATITASAPGGTYKWYNASGTTLLFTGSSFTTPVLSTTTSYLVETNVSGCTSPRTTVTVTVTPVPAAPSGTGATLCAGNTTTLTATASGTLNWFTAASGGSSLQTGGNYTTPVLTVSSTYYAENTVAGCASSRTAVIATVTPIPAAPSAASAATCNGTSIDLSATAPGGTYTWYNTAGTLLHTGPVYTTPVLNASTSYFVQTTLSNCASSRTTVNVTTNPIPAVPSLSVSPVCVGNTATVTVVSPVAGVLYEWYDSPSAGNLVTTSTGFTTPALSNNINYYVQATLSGCSSSRTTAAISVTQPPASPVAANVFICTGNSAVITASAPGGFYEWYSASTGGTLLTTGANFTTPVLNATTQYYVQTTVAGCTGTRSAVSVNVNPAPAAPTVLGSTICAGNSSSLTATSPGGTYQWYDAGGTLLLTGANYITPSLNNTTTYYVQSTIAGCTGPRASVAVTVLQAPAAPTASGSAVCTGSTTSLVASAPGGTYQWYDAASGGNLLFTGPAYITAPLNNSTTYYVQSTIGSCTGQRTAVPVTVNPVPAAPAVAGGSICEGSTLTLNASGPGGIYQWYDSNLSGNQLFVGNSYTTAALTKTTVFFVQVTQAGCTSQRTAVTATAIPMQLPAFKYASGTFCTTGTNPTPVIENGNGGTFSATPAGLVFVSTSTGEINISASALGSYTIQFITNGACVYSSSARVTITNSPDATFAYTGPYCPQQFFALPVFTPGTSAGIFSSATPGLVFSSNSTGEIDLKKSTPGTYTVTNKIAASGGCAAADATNTVTVLASPVSIAGPGQTVCSDNIVSLNGSIGGTAASGSWSGGSGSFTNASQLITQYKPAAGESNVKLFLTTDDPSGPCTAAVDSLTLFINPAPAAPVAQSVTVCTNNTATLIATSPGGLYEWYSTAAGGTALASGNTFVSPSLLNNTTYYVQSTINNCTGTRSPVTITVSPKPLIQSAASGEVCSATQFTYLITSDQAGTVYLWTRSVVPGISNPAYSGQSDSSITDVLNNITGNTVPVTYSIVPVKQGCSGDPFFYTASVKPTPAAPSINNSTPVCAGSSLNLFTNAITGATYFWSGPNGFSSVQQNPVIPTVTTASAGIYRLSITVNNCSSPPSAKNISPVIAAPTAASNSPLCEQGTLFLTAAGLPGATYSWRGPSGFSSVSQNPSLSSIKINNSGVYYVTAAVAGCTGLTDSVAVTVNIPPSTPSVASNSPVCNRDSITLKTSVVTNNVNFLWSGPSGFKSVSASPLIANAEKTNEGVYNLTVSAPGCAITSASSLSVLVNQRPQILTIKNNGPICEGDTLLLAATSQAGAAFSWNTLSGFSSSLQNPKLPGITKANEDTYRVVASLNGCPSDTAITKVTIVKASVAYAGNNSTVCANNAQVTLAGTISGEDTQAGKWSSDGSGSFLSGNDKLANVYVPSQADTAKKKVTLTLQTANNKGCPVSASNIEIRITPAPRVNAGIDSLVCANDSLIHLSGEVLNAIGGVWTGSGSGNFQNISSLNRTYVPSRSDIQKGKVSFYLASSGNGNCLVVSDTVQYIIQPVPFVNAGNDLTIFENETIQLKPQIKDGVTFLWTPFSNLSSDTVAYPMLTGKINQEYKIRVTGAGSCITEDQVFVRVLKAFIIPNIFTPNGDNIHDSWEIPELANYPGAIVEIFTRSGARIYSTVGYEKPWDGTFNGKPVPVATYYYIIKPNFRNLIFSGSVTIVR